MTLTELIKDNYCSFDSYRQGFLYYHIYIPTGDWNDYTDKSLEMTSTPMYAKYQFTIPIDDVGNATMNKREKAITLMRWIRKAYESNELIKIK